MYPSNDEKRENTTPVNMTASEPVGEQPCNESTYSEPYYDKSLQNDPGLIDQRYNEQTYNEPTQGEPAYSSPGYPENSYHDQQYNTSPYDGQTYSSPVYSEPDVKEPLYRESPETQWNMYSPGICVNQPYPRNRINDTARSGAPRRRSNRLIGGIIRAVCLVLVCSLFSGAAAYTVMDYRFKRGDFTVNNQVVLGGAAADTRQDENLTAPVAAMTGGMSAQDIYDRARTQVVGITTEAPGMFGSSDFSTTVTPVSGSGFIISSDGYILTNFHVIELAHTRNLPLNVILNDGSSYEAKVIGFEKINDVAVIKIDATGLNPAIIGNSDNIRVGQTIYAVGNPFGDLVYTMTDGIVSALDRVVSVDGRSIGTFQFSAAVNSGNSGGPIYDTYGEVLGIVTAKVVRGNVEGIGFAIPINDAIEIASELIEHGYILGRPLIGITGQTVSPGHAEYYGWVVGTYVRSVNPGSAAEAAGISVGDIITALDDQKVDSMATLRFALRSHKAGETATITVWRDGDAIDLSITFDEDLHAGQPEERPLLEPDSPNPFENYP